MSRLAEVAEQALALHSAPPRGTVIGPRGRFFPESVLEALYCAAPVYFADGLSEVSGFADPFVLIWLVPIASIEATYIDTHGWSRFEDQLVAADPDLLDLLRSPVVDHS